jgi:hypothetical protein
MCILHQSGPWRSNATFTTHPKSLIARKIIAEIQPVTTISSSNLAFTDFDQRWHACFCPTFVAVKKVIAIGLIFVMFAQCFYKLGMITYFQLNREYVAEVLCINKEKPITMCYGKCFLENNLKLVDERATDDVPVPPAKTQIDFPAFLIVENNYSFGSSLNFEIAESGYLSGTSSKHSDIPFHPPTLLS